MTETAAEIIADGQEVEETEDEAQSIDDEFRDLQSHTEELAIRLNKVATTLETQGAKPATKKDIAQLYRFMSGDVVNCIRDLVNASGASFIDIFDIIESNDDEDGEGSEEEGDDNTPSEADIQVYTTLLANVEAFTNLSKTAGLPEKQKTAFEQMIELNKGNLEPFHEGFGEEVMKEAAAKRLSEAQGGGAATE